MADFRRRKTNERQVNQAIFENLSLLSRCYPTSDQFKLILNANMFAKPNKAGFQEVTFYLLTVIKPQFACEKLKSWPLINPKQDVQYRMELIECFNVLNSMYKYADIPMFQPSQLVSPGGYRIAVLLLKLSQLAINEHLRKFEIPVIFPPKPSVNAEIKTSLISDLRETAASIEKESEHMLVKFNTEYLLMRDEAQFVSSLIRNTHMDIGQCTKELKESKEKHASNIPILLDLEVVAVKRRLDKILEINQLFSSSKVLLEQLADLTLKHDPTNALLPAEIAHLVPSQDGQLDLIQYFEGLAAWLQRISVKIPSLSPSYVSQCIEMAEDLLSKQEPLLQQFKSHELLLKRLLEKMVHLGQYRRKMI